MVYPPSISDNLRRLWTAFHGSTCWSLTTISGLLGSSLSRFLPLGRPRTEAKSVTDTSHRFTRFDVEKIATSDASLDGRRWKERLGPGLQMGFVAQAFILQLM
jgi:hypothetical protein